MSAGTWAQIFCIKVECVLNCWSIHLSTSGEVLKSIIVFGGILWGSKDNVSFLLLSGFWGWNTGLQPSSQPHTKDTLKQWSVLWTALFPLFYFKVFNWVSQHSPMESLLEVSLVFPGALFDKLGRKNAALNPTALTLSAPYLESNIQREANGKRWRLTDKYSTVLKYGS